MLLFYISICYISIKIITGVFFCNKFESGVKLFYTTAKCEFRIANIFDLDYKLGQKKLGQKLT